MVPRPDPYVLSICSSKRIARLADEHSSLRQILASAGKLVREHVEPSFNVRRDARWRSKPISDYQRAMLEQLDRQLEDLDKKCAQGGQLKPSDLEWPTVWSDEAHQPDEDAMDDHPVVHIDGVWLGGRKWDERISIDDLTRGELSDAITKMKFHGLWRVWKTRQAARGVQGTEAKPEVCSARKPEDIPSWRVSRPPEDWDEEDHE